MKKILIATMLFIPTISLAADCQLATVLAWKYGHVAGTRQVNQNDMSVCPEMYISSWNHGVLAQPDDAQLVLDYAEYAVGGVRATKKAVADSLADDKVLAIIDEETQRNYTARALDLTNILASGGTLTAPEQAEMVTIRSVWDQVRAVRVAESAIKAELDAITDAGAMDAYDVTNNPLWP